MKDSPVSWENLLKQAVKEPGRIEAAFHAFHGYSLGNQLLAMFQCTARGIKLGPISTYVGWKDKGRHVRKGEKALLLCMPITCKRSDGDSAESDGDGAHVFTRFIYRANWFVLSQTEGEDYLPELIADRDFDLARALNVLKITRVEFESLNGNVQGYAKSGRRLAINPVAQSPMATAFHEIGHILLGHCDQGADQLDGERLTRSLKEVEAESVALLCLESLGLPGAEFARGYIQNWITDTEIPERSCQKIFKAADQILKAGSSESAGVEVSQ